MLRGRVGVAWSLPVVAILVGVAIGGACTRPDRVYNDGPGVAGSAGNGPMDPSNGVGAIGDPCDEEGRLACASTNDRVRLLCESGRWASFGQCSSDERCDTRPENAGTCEPVLEECEGKRPGDAVCRGSERFTCGVDLLTEEDAETCSGGCVAGECTACDPGDVRCAGNNGLETCGAQGEWELEACPAAAPHCSAGACGQPPSCEGLSATCGATGDEPCCTSPQVAGGTYYRINDTGYSPATVSDLRLDKYEVTVGRFRRFVQAVLEEEWRPPAGSGKHVHLNDGDGLALLGGGGQESGWDAEWTLPETEEDWEYALGCEDQGTSYATWTPSSGDNERRPINCVSWYEAHAFCIWDGGFLPSEAEWNYAVAGGSEQRAYPWGDEPVPGATLAVFDCNYESPCSGVTNIAPVGSLAAGNGKWGQADLVGNVYEWNLDLYGAAITTFAVSCVDCAHLVEDGFTFTRVVRGGGFQSANSSVATSYRDVNMPSPADRFHDIGLRCARSP